MDEARVLHAWADAIRSVLGIRTRAFWVTILEPVFSGLESRSFSTRALLSGCRASLRTRDVVLVMDAFSGVKLSEVSCLHYARLRANATVRR